MQAKVGKHFSFTFCTSLLYHTWYEAHRDIFTPQTLIEYSFSPLKWACTRMYVLHRHLSRSLGSNHAFFSFVRVGKAVWTKMV